jgi:hypothetical protein
MTPNLSTKIPLLLVAYPASLLRRLTACVRS